MKSVKEILTALTKSNQDRLEKARKIAENMIKTAEAAKKAAQKK